MLYVFVFAFAVSALGGVNSDVNAFQPQEKAGPSRGDTVTQVGLQV